MEYGIELRGINISPVVFQDQRSDPAEINVSRPIAFQYRAQVYIFVSHLTAAYPVNAISRIMMIIVGTLVSYVSADRCR